MQENLARGLSVVSRAVSSRSTLPVLANVMLRTEDAGLKLTATNLEIGITYWVPGKIETDGATTVPAKLLTDLVNSLPAGDRVDLELQAGDVLHLRCGRFESHIKGIDADEFPAIGAAGERPTTRIAQNVLRRALAETAFAAASDEARPILTGVLAKFEGDQLTLAAADGFRLAIRTLSLTDTTTRAAWIVPARTLVEVAHSLPSTPGLPVTLSGTAGDHQLHVALGDVEISSRLIDGQFPDYERIIPSDSATSVILGTADLLRATRVAAVFARDNANVIRLECTPPPEDGTPALGHVLVKATSAEMGDNVGQLDASVRGNAGQISFNGRYLRDALEVIGSPQVALQLTGDQRPGVLRPVGEFETGHLQIIMPMRPGR